MSIAAYQHLGSGNVAVVLPAPLPDMLRRVADALRDKESRLGEGPLAVASTQLADVDPLAVLEAEMVADELKKSADSARNRQDRLAGRMLRAGGPGKDIRVAVTFDQLLTLSGWFNRLYVTARRNELDQSDEDVQVGAGQSVFDDAGLAELLGHDADDIPDADNEHTPISLVTLLLAGLATELLAVHRTLTATPS